MLPNLKNKRGKSDWVANQVSTWQLTAEGASPHQRQSKVPLPPGIATAHGPRPSISASIYAQLESQPNQPFQTSRKQYTLFSHDRQVWIPPARQVWLARVCPSSKKTFCNLGASTFTKCFHSLGVWHLEVPNGPYVFSSLILSKDLSHFFIQPWVLPEDKVEFRRYTMYNRKCSHVETGLGTAESRLGHGH